MRQTWPRCALRLGSRVLPRLPATPPTPLPAHPLPSARRRCATCARALCVCRCSAGSFILSVSASIALLPEHAKL